MVTANLDFYSGDNRQYLAHLCADSDLVLVQEAKDLDLGELIPDGWRALQDTSSDAKAGSGILVSHAISVERWWLRRAVAPLLAVGCCPAICAALK